MKAAIYARKSTDDSDRSDDNKSVTRQVERAKAYADARGWSVSAEHVFTDDGISGGEFINRPGFSRLMDAAKRRELGAIIMSEPSRLGRDMIRTSYHRVEMSSVDDRVLEAIEHLVLAPANVAYVVERAAHLVARRLRENPGRPREIETEIAKLRRETDRLVAAIAADDPPQSLVAALRDRKARIETLTGELVGLRTNTAPGALDVARLKRALRERAGRFKDELRADVPAGPGGPQEAPGRPSGVQACHGWQAEKLCIRG